MPTTKKPFYLTIQRTRTNEAGETETYTDTFYLSVRRSRAERMWRRMRNTSDWKGAAFHAPPERDAGLKRFKAQQEALKGAVERASTNKRLKAKLNPDGLVPDEMIDAYRFLQKWNKGDLRDATQQMR